MFEQLKLRCSSRSMVEQVLQRTDYDINTGYYWRSFYKSLLISQIFSDEQWTEKVLEALNQMTNI